MKKNSAFNYKFVFSTAFLLTFFSAFSSDAQLVLNIKLTEKGDTLCRNEVQLSLAVSGELTDFVIKGGVFQHQMEFNKMYTMEIADEIHQSYIVRLNTDVPDDIKQASIQLPLKMLPPNLRGQTREVWVGFDPKTKEFTQQ